MSPLTRTAACSIAAMLLALPALPSAAQEPGRAHAKPAPVDGKVAAVDEALRLSDLRNELAASRVWLKQLLDGTPNLDPEARRWLWQTVASPLSLEGYTKAVRQALLDDYDADMIGRVLGWYRSPVGRKMARLEQVGLEPAQAQAKKAYLASLESKPPSEQRLVAVFRIDEASRRSQGAFDALKSVVSGWSSGIDDAISDQARQRAAEAETARASFRAQTRDMVAEDVLKDMLYAYRDATDAELGAYAEFHESDACRWLFNTAYRAQQDFLERASNAIAEESAAAMEGKRAERAPSAAAAGRPRAAPSPALPPRTLPTVPVPK
jgi:hypothetical protein